MVLSIFSERFLYACIIFLKKASDIICDEKYHLKNLINTLTCSWCFWILFNIFMIIINQELLLLANLIFCFWTIPIDSNGYQHLYRFFAGHRQHFFSIRNIDITTDFLFCNAYLLTILWLPIFHNLPSLPVLRRWLFLHRVVVK